MVIRMRTRTMRPSAGPLAASLAAALATMAANASQPAPNATSHTAPAGAIVAASTDGAGFDGGIPPCSDAAVRGAISGAGNGDVVDLSALVHCTVTLVGGELPAHVDNLALHGPPDGSLTIDGNRLTRVLDHTGNGTLALDHMRLANGHADGDGGCIRSAGSVILNGVTVTACAADGSGGGVYAHEVFTADDSVISDNTSGAWGGGVGTFYGNIDVTRCTFSGNHAGSVGGGLYAFYGTHVGIDDSTISGNAADIKGGGGAAWSGLTVHNSTIAFNTSVQQPGGGIHVAHGPVEFTSSIVSNNTGHFAGGDAASDVYSDDPAIVIDGSHNLIMSSSQATPGDTLTGDPGLFPLADNGGPTRTHAIRADSPAFDAGANPDMLGSDQRGDGYLRLFVAAPDIGAFELQAPPGGHDDAYTVVRGTPLAVAAPGVLANDTDAFGLPLTAALLDPPAHGTLTLNADGGFDYVPEAAYTGVDHFTYAAGDRLGTSAPAAVTIAITFDEAIFANGFDPP